MTEFKLTERKWQQLNKKLDNLAFYIAEVNQQLPRRAKRWLRFEECVPPVSVCKDVVSMMTGIENYEGFLGRLSEYYGCEAMAFTVDPNIDPKYLAVYNPNLKQAYSRQPTIEKASVLHEWFHHLVNLKVVVVNKKDEEFYAQRYAEAFLRRATS